MDKQDLKAMSVIQLRELIENAQAVLPVVEEREMKAARKEVNNIAAQYGMSLDEVLGKGSFVKKGPKRAPKFRNPENPSEVWSGLGRQPQWFKAKLSDGVSPDDMRI